MNGRIPCTHNRQQQNIALDIVFGLELQVRHFYSELPPALFQIHSETQNIRCHCPSSHGVFLTLIYLHYECGGGIAGTVNQQILHGTCDGHCSVTFRHAYFFNEERLEPFYVNFGDTCKQDIIQGK